MLFDKLATWFDDTAYGSLGTGVEVDLQETKPGLGEPKCIVVRVSSTYATTDGATSITVTSATSSGGSYATDLIVGPFSDAELQAGVHFFLPSNINRYVKITMADTTNITAGTGSVFMVPQTAAQDKHP